MNNKLISRFKSIYEYLTHFRLIAFDKINIHNCINNLHYWEEELSRGVYCSVCSKIVSQEAYEPFYEENERLIDIDEDMTGSWSTIPSNSNKEIQK